MRGHNAVDGREAQTGAAADHLGGEERLEDPVADLLVDADPIVGDGKPHMVSLPCIRMALPVRLVDPDVLQLDPNPRLPIVLARSAPLFLTLLHQRAAGAY